MSQDIILCLRIDTSGGSVNCSAPFEKRMELVLHSVIIIVQSIR